MMGGEEEMAISSLSLSRFPELLRCSKAQRADTSTVGFEMGVIMVHLGARTLLGTSPSRMSISLGCMLCGVLARCRRNRNNGPKLALNKQGVHRHSSRSQSHCS